MMLAGDEMGRTQAGTITPTARIARRAGLTGNRAKENQRFFAFVCRLIAIRKQHPSFHRRQFLQGRRIRGVKDIIWLTPDGNEMTDEEWNKAHARCLGIFLAGEGIEEFDERGRAISDDDFIILLNSHYETIPFVIPLTGSPNGWTVL